MNIENIAQLAEQISKLGFQDCSSELLKRISFRPASITIKQKIPKGAEEFQLQLYLERNFQEASYCLKYFDCSIQIETKNGQEIIDGIDTALLERNMESINWKQAFDWDAPLKWSVADKTSWEPAVKIEAIIESLTKLELSASGKACANKLKQKYWVELQLSSMMPLDLTPKGKPEISQRFYCTAGLPEITVGEACRYLQNKLLEKQLLDGQKKIRKADKSKTGPGPKQYGNGSSIKKQSKMPKEKTHPNTISYKE